jgi:hypothetical protein
MTQA